MPSTQQVGEQYWNAAIWETCACLTCQPRLHEEAAHPADLRPFNLLRGLTWKGHDAWRIASLAVSSFSERAQHQKTNHEWTAFLKKYQLVGPRRAAADRLDEEALGEGIEILSDIYFLGQLPSSKFYVQWAVLPKGQLASLQPGLSLKDRMVLWLNCDHVPLRNCPKRILCVVLHEMTHAFFDYYACSPWMRRQCGQSACGKLYHLNIGATGHGRAWQYLIYHIQRSMRDALGFEGSLGRKVAMYKEMEAGGREGVLPMVALPLVGLYYSYEGRSCRVAHPSIEKGITQQSLALESLKT
ncbi:hypothetical protein PRZ48_004427 [Zasmidium cellare]|uniref:SprT-like domain-containing protein n=1 Tax=Zasmidium cellare TaxID=395010 RepID=A0ABR0EPV6_ZASCE|nr:hypothetical protein PRZ48_004427 [Zasmidium cellare]